MNLTQIATSITNVVTDVRTAIAVDDTPTARRVLLAQLGSTRFEVVGPIQELASTRGYSYAQHEVIEGKPRLQATGDELEQLVLTLRFHPQFGDPVGDYADLCLAAAQHQAMPFVWGSGAVMGRYVITEIDDTIDAMDELGRVTLRTTRVTLLEWVESTPLEVRSQQKKKTSATAAATASSAPKKTVRAPTDPLYGAELPEDVPLDVLLRYAVRAGTAAGDHSGGRP